jgi:hypothetical protein
LGRYAGLVSTVSLGWMGQERERRVGRSASEEIGAPWLPG